MEGAPVTLRVPRGGAYGSVSMVKSAHSGPRAAVGWRLASKEARGGARGAGAGSGHGSSGGGGGGGGAATASVAFALCPLCNRPYRHGRPMRAHLQVGATSPRFVCMCVCVCVCVCEGVWRDRTAQARAQSTETFREFAREEF